MAVFNQVLKMRAFVAAHCLENRWYDRFEKFCRVQTRVGVGEAHFEIVGNGEKSGKIPQNT